MALEKYQFKIEGVIIQTPEGWKEFELRLKRDDDIAGLLISSTNKFTFQRDGYLALKSRFDDNYNDKVNVTIDILQSDNTYLEKYSGVVILTDVKFNLEKLTAEATIEDSSFQGAIQSNKNIKAFLNSGITKNGEEVTVPTEFELDYFQSNGSYSPVQTRTHFRVKDALDFLVRFMTDDIVKGVQSIYLDDESNFEGDSLLYITTGEEIRINSAPAPNVSFSELITFLQVTHDLSFDFVTNTNGDKVMRIEEREFFFNQSSIDTIRDILDLSVQIDANKISSHLEVGNNTAFTSGNCSATTRFFSFQKEDYSLRGKGNVDGLLNLTNDLVTDSNVIQDVVNNNNDEFDDNIIIVMGNSSASQVTRFQDVDFCSNNFFYNLGFLNNKIIDRQISSIPNSLTKYLTAATTPSKAEKGNTDIIPIDTTLLSVIVDNTVNYTDEQFDLGNNYNTSDVNNTFYDVPFAGEFSFEVSLEVIYSISQAAAGVINSAPIFHVLSIQQFDSSFTTLKGGASTVRQFRLEGPIGTNERFTDTVTVTLTCATGDRIRVNTNSNITSAPTLTLVTLLLVSNDQETFFKCLGASNDAGTYKVFDPNSFRARQYRFEKNLSLTRTDIIRANTRNSLIINELSDTDLDKEVWIEEMVNNIETGDVSFTMIN
ncbi:hypothetical protein LCGC14_0388480 [marine sediment metagenome]|uniref:Uncharacterized protein n=1 Tax=marine sediment metagenome TaxID=412755 RepID=A0A0F9VMC7_9ZZZZ